VRSIGFPELVVVLAVLCFIVFMLFVYGRIFCKAGYSRWISLTMFVPLVNIGVLIWFAFAEWPIIKELGRLRLTTQSSPQTGTRT
jgi:hypothetical protein